nr:CAP domain-containing protein [Oceanospirillum sediminis]
MLLSTLPAASYGYFDNNDRFLNWAEFEYPDLFPGQEETQTENGWTYRFYPDTKIYLGIDESSKVYIQGGRYGEEPVEIGWRAHYKDQYQEYYKTHSCRPDFISKEEIYKYHAQLREQAGMIRMQRADYLENAAQKHSDYLIANDTTGHTEERYSPQFTGKTAANRAMHTGGQSNQVSEVISYSRTLKSSIDRLFSGIYHRFIMLSFRMNSIGTGYSVKENQCGHNLVINYSNSFINHLCSYDSYKGGTSYSGICAVESRKVGEREFKEAKNQVLKENPAFIIWPHANSIDIPVNFTGEKPDPLPNYDKTGYPVSIAFNPYYFPIPPDIISFQLFDDQGLLIDEVIRIDQYTDVNNKLDSHEFAFFPIEELQYDSEYRAELVYELDGDHSIVSWKFKTRSK